MKKFVVAGLLLAGFATPALSEMRRTGRSRDTLARSRVKTAPDWKGLDGANQG